MSTAKFDAVIIDCDDLQGGAEVLRHLRQTRSNKTSVSFAILNGKTTTQQAFEMGANFVLQKPLTPSSTIRCFNAALGFMERERRRYFRCLVKIPVTVQVAGSGEVKGIATNLSEGGMAIRLQTPIPKQAVSTIKFNLPGTRTLLEPKAEVAWADGSGRAGIRFTEFSDSARQQLEAWILRQLEAPSLKPSSCN
jgi:CheY-like chemotaxis protein